DPCVRMVTSSDSGPSHFGTAANLNPCEGRSSPLGRGGDDRSGMNLAVLATVFGVVFVAELPDKTALASLVLGTRYRPVFVFAGVAAAFAVHVVLAVSAGSLLFLLPHRAVQAVVAVLFAVGAILMLRRRDDEDPGPADADELAGAPDRPGEDRGDGEAGGGVATLVRPVARVVTHDGFWRVAWRSFAVLFVAEFGDLTQLVT